MSLANLLNIPHSPEELLVWSFHHQDHHLKINNAIFNQKNIELPLYPLDPMPDPQSPGMATWAETHQSAHTEFDGILNLAGSDFTSVDFTKQDQVESWVRLHFTEHLEAQLALGFAD